MQLPIDVATKEYRRPDLFLCEPNKEKIGILDVTNLQGDFKFNAYSELTFEVSRIYNDPLTGETKLNPYYDKIEALRLLYLEGFGYFEIQGPEISGDGIKEVKNVTAYSLEYTLSQKYLSDFYINTGEVDSVEVINAVAGSIVPVTLYNVAKPELSLMHLILEKAYGWKIGHIDESLKTLSRQFEVDRESIYDFIINEICAKFNCYAVFDTIENTINLYAESLTSKFIGDGVTKLFTISPPFSQLNTVSVGGYKTTQWDYYPATGKLEFVIAPEAGALIEAVDGATQQWESDVFISFDNLSQEISLEYDADEIKTVLTVTYGDDEDIREANIGLPYITDLSYYYNVDWMGKELYDAYTKYMQKTNEKTNEYTARSQKMQEVYGHINYETNRFSLQYEQKIVTGNTVGKYYVRGGTSPNYYYTEVSLPSEYKAGTQYYTTADIGINENKVKNLYEVLKNKFTKGSVSYAESEELKDEFSFMQTYTVGYLENNGWSDAAILNFLGEMWEQVGLTPLQQLYYEPYKKIQISNIEAGWSNTGSGNHGNYYPVVLYLQSIETAIAARKATIAEYQKQYDELATENAKISVGLQMSENFTEDQLAHLSAFLREDEVHFDDIVRTAQDSLAGDFKIKQDAMESGRIELHKISQPQLKFSMSLANLYALEEFKPIVKQFQLGRVIKVALRQDYIKQSRLLEVHINFDDFSDFSADFGELTSLRTQSDIHADLLSQAVQAGKTVASSSNYWTNGVNMANEIDLKLQAGLLNSIEALKATDGTQNAFIDKYGIHLEAPDKNNPEEISDERIWMVNNQIVFTDDAFKTTKLALGKITTLDGQTFYGLCADYVLSGLVESSKIKGGTIQIGEQPDGSWAFQVNEKGVITFHAPVGEDGNKIYADIDGYTTSDELDAAKKALQQYTDGQIETLGDKIIALESSGMYRVEVQTTDSQIFRNKSQKAILRCKVYSWDRDITDSLDARIFKWIRTSGDVDSDSAWNADSSHIGVKTLEITTDDIAYNASFYCEVDIPEQTT